MGEKVVVSRRIANLRKKFESLGDKVSKEILSEHHSKVHMFLNHCKPLIYGAIAATVVLGVNRLFGDFVAKHYNEFIAPYVGKSNSFLMIDVYSTLSPWLVGLGFYYNYAVEHEKKANVSYKLQSAKYDSLFEFLSDLKHDSAPVFDLGRDTGIINLEDARDTQDLFGLIVAASTEIALANGGIGDEALTKRYHQEKDVNGIIRSYLDQMGIGYCNIRKDGRMIGMNKALKQMTGIRINGTVTYDLEDGELDCIVEIAFGDVLKINSYVSEIKESPGTYFLLATPVISVKNGKE